MKYRDYIKKEVAALSDKYIAEAMEHNRDETVTLPPYLVGTTADTIKNVLSAAACIALSIVIVIAFILMRNSISQPPADSISDTETIVTNETETEAETETETEKPKDYQASNSEYEYTVTNGEVTLNRYIGTAENVEIPVSIDGYPVKYLGTYVLEEMPEIEQALITGMFAGSAARHVTIPGHMDTVEGITFLDAVDIKTVVIEEGVALITGGAFIDCTSLEEITIPKSVLYIGSNSFRNPPKTVYYLGTEDEWNTLLSESGTDTGLEEANVIFEATEDSIYDEDFIYDENVFETEDFVYTVTDGAVTLVSYIGEETEGVNIPAEIDGMKVTRIEKGTFSNKQGKNVAFIIIPPTIESVAEGAYDKNYIGGVYFLGSEEHYKEIYEGDTTFANERIYYWYCYLSEDGLYWYRLSDDGNAELIRYFGDEEEITVPTQIDGHPVTAIGIWDYPEHSTEIGKYYYVYDGVYEGAPAKKITVPGSIKTLYSACLMDCENLETLILEEGIETLGSWMLRGSKVKEVVIPSTVTDLGSFESDTLEKVTLPEGLKEISYGAFHECTALEEVNIPDSVERIYELAFCNCTSLSDIDVPDSVVDIGYSAFLNTPWYENQPDGPVYAGRVFYKYKGDLPENGKVKIKRGTIAIAEQAFEGSTLKEVDIPEGVVYIGDEAFHECDKLTEIDMPKSLERIGVGVFSCCDELIRVGLNEGLKCIDTWAFIECPKLKTIHLPSTLELIGWITFGEHEEVFFNGTEAEWRAIVEASPEDCEPSCGVTFLK